MDAWTSKSWLVLALPAPPLRERLGFYLRELTSAHERDHHITRPLKKRRESLPKKSKADMHPDSYRKRTTHDRVMTELNQFTMIVPFSNVASTIYFPRF